MPNCVTCNKLLGNSGKHSYRVVPKSKCDFVPKLELQRQNIPIAENDEGCICQPCRRKLLKIQNLRQELESANVNFTGQDNQNQNLEPNTPSNLQKERNVHLKIQYENTTREKVLPPDLEHLGKALGRGTFKDKANAAFKHRYIKMELIKLFLKTIAKESEIMCSRKDPSLLRQTRREDIVQFKFENFVNELKIKAPVLCGALMAATIKNSHDENSNLWVPTITVAASVLLKNRCLHMNAFQIVMNTIMHHSSQTVSQGLILLLCNDGYRFYYI